MRDHDAHERGSESPDEREDSAPIEKLRELWGALEAPAPDDSDAPSDPLADEAVRRLRAAWVQLAAPPAELPWRLRRRRVAPVVGVLAAAALVLAAVAIGLSQRDERPRAEPIADAGGESNTPPDGALPTEPPFELPIELPVEPPVSPPVPPTDAPRAQPRGEIDAGGRLVLRSGSVRLVWVEPTPAAPTPNTQP